MANDTLSLGKIVSIFRDLSLRNEMVNDFYYGPSYNIGATTPIKFPYIAIEQGQAQTLRSLNGYKENVYTFQVYCMDKINKGDDNYDEIISDTKFILDSIISEMSQHQYYIDMNISLVGDISMEVVQEATDDNVNGWVATITLKNPVRYTPCNVPIEPISGYTTVLNSSITEYRLIGATGPQGPIGPTGPAGVNGATGGFSTIYYDEMLITNFQITNKALSSTNFGSNTGVAVGFWVPKRVQIITATIEVTVIATNPTTSEFAIYSVENGVPTTRLFHFTYNMTVTGLYVFTFPANTILEPGLYAWATSQSIIAGYRTFNLTDQIFGMNVAVGQNPFINGKSCTTAGLPSTYVVSANYFNPVPNCNFEIIVL